ncbi:MAG: hypothetical protein JRN20_22260, partial [Nitrososphaerota archaeon]|nr:hypothetical protein [Nitrososphaerota archaeon]
PPVASENKSGRFGRLIGAIHPNSMTKQNELRGSQTVQVQESQRTDGYSISSEAELERRRLAQVAAQQATPQASRQVTTVSSASESSESPVEKAQSSHPRSPTSQREGRDSSEGREMQTTVTYQQYVTLLAENRKLREEMKSMVPVSQYEALEARNRELIETMGLMVPREDYEKLQDRLVEMVPKSMYIDLQRTVTSMVPKEMYLEAEARASSLKAQLDASVPSKVLDELATRINVLSASASIQDSSYLEEAPLGFRKRNLGSDEMPEE